MKHERSIYGELQSTANYIELSDEELFDRAQYFAKLGQDKETMPQARADIQIILGRLTFEIMARDNISVVNM